jgi:DNA-binding response OmpR family regulator
MAKQRKPAKILIVEDNDPDVFLVEEALRAHSVPAQIQRCQDGEEAIQVLSQLDQSEVPDIVIIDLNLPKVPGIEILKHARSLKQLDSVPVLILTSSQSHADRILSLQLGADAYIAKPPTLHEFLSSVGSGIRSLLERSESGASTRLLACLCNRPGTRHWFRTTPAILQSHRNRARSSRLQRFM